MAIGRKFAPPYGCIFMDHTETQFLKTQDIKIPGCGRDLLIAFFYMDKKLRELKNF